MIRLIYVGRDKNDKDDNDDDKRQWCDNGRRLVYMVVAEDDGYIGCDKDIVVADYDEWQWVWWGQWWLLTMMSDIGCDKEIGGCWQW